MMTIRSTGINNKPSLPTVDPTPAMADSILAQTMNRLSMKEREQVFDDIHGVGDVVREERDFVNQCLDQLQIELDTIPTNIKIAYTMARSQCLEYVSNRKFQLMFLRAESFQPQLAAYRMTSFFTSKLELFGPDKLTKDIQLSDLDQSDILCLESGYMQLLPGRDRSGRPVLCMIPFCAPLQATLVNKLRTLWYMFMTTLEDEDSQRCGIVGLVYNIGPKRRIDREAVWKNSILMADLPIKMVSLHYFLDDPKTQMLANLAVTILETKTRTRFRIHTGSDMEILYKLLAFGITQEILPFSANGKIKLENHQMFIKRRRSGDESSARGGSLATENESKQQQQDEDVRVVVPHPMDVLLGRGRHGDLHPGNLRLQRLLDAYSEQYDREHRSDKTVTAELIVGLIKNPQPNEPGVSPALLFGGGRFLTNDSMGWKVMDDEMARERVSHRFRNRRRVRPAAVPRSKQGSKSTTMVGTARPSSATRYTDNTAAVRFTEQEELPGCATHVFGCFNTCKRLRLA